MDNKFDIGLERRKATWAQSMWRKTSPPPMISRGHFRRR